MVITKTKTHPTKKRKKRKETKITTYKRTHHIYFLRLRKTHSRENVYMLFFFFIC